MASGAEVIAPDRRLVFWLGGAVLLVIALVSVFAPVEANNDPRPSTYNSAPGGAKAAFLTLKRLGWPVFRSDRPIHELVADNPSRTTLVLAEPNYSALEKDSLTRDLKQFLERGGRVLVTGSGGALLLPGGTAAKPSSRLKTLCYTRPEGPGPLARTGEVEMLAPAYWEAEEPGIFVEQRCGPEAVVVRFRVGAGEAVWWSSASPLTNAELHRDADLHLLLASLGRDRRVLFDESLQDRVPTKWDAAGGLPLRAMLAQAALLFALLVFSFSRRRGPLRLPVTLPRSSPLEFAVSMGDLYGKAGATGAATEAARRRLERALVREAGLPRATVQAGPEDTTQALTARFGSTWREVGEHLQQARDAADTNLKPASALKLVQALGADRQRLRDALRALAQPKHEVPGKPGTLVAKDKTTQPTGEV